MSIANVKKNIDMPITKRKNTIERTCSGLHTDVVIVNVKKTLIVWACLGNHREDIGCAHNITIIISKKNKKIKKIKKKQANVHHHLAMSISYV